MDLTQFVLDSIPQLLFWKDRDSIYRGCNGRFARIAGVEDPAAIVGKTDHDLAWPEEQAVSARESDRRIFESGQPESRVIEPWKPDGRQRSWLATKVPLRDAAGEIVGVFGTSVEITESREAAEEIRRSRGNLQTLFDTLDDFLLVLAPDGRILQANAIVRTRLGYEEEDLAALRIHDIHTEDRRSEVDTLLAAAAAGRVTLGTISLRTRGGARIPVETKIARGQWAGEPALFVVSRDVTERVRAEEALRRAHEEHASRIVARTRELAEANACLDVFRLFVEACNRGTGWIDPDGCLLYANPALVAMLGEETAEDAAGVSLREYYGEADGHRLRDEALPAALETGRWSGVLTVRPRHGAEFVAVHHVSVLRDPSGRPASFSVVITDETELEPD